MSIVGNTYLEKGEPVEIVAQWRGKSGARPCFLDESKGQPVELDPKRPDITFSQLEFRARSGPRNVLIRRRDGWATTVLKAHDRRTTASSDERRSSEGHE